MYIMFYNLVSFQPTVPTFLSYWNILGTYLPDCSPVATIGPIMSFRAALSKEVYCSVAPRGCHSRVPLSTAESQLSVTDLPKRSRQPLIDKLTI